MKHSKLRWLLEGLMALMVLSLMLSGVAQAKKVYNLKFELVWNTEHPEFKAYQKFIKMVKKETHGRVTFTLFPASQLVPRTQALVGLKNGVIDMLASAGAYYHGMVPEIDFDWMPFVAAGHRKEFWKFINTGKVYKIIYDANLKKANAVWLTDVLCGSEGIIGRDHNIYKTVEQLKGIKLRAAGGISTRTAIALGASPVTIATGELYPALQRGTIDAAIFPEYGLKDYQLYEVAKTYTKPGFYIWADDLWINKDTFNKLPKDIQKTIKRVAHEWGYWASTVYWPNYLKGIDNWVKKRGVTIVYMSPSEVKKARELVQPVWRWYASQSPQCAELVKLLKEEIKKWKE